MTETPVPGGRPIATFAVVILVVVGPAVDCCLLADLLAAARAGGTLKSTPKLPLQMRVDDTDRVAGRERPATRYGYARVSTREQKLASRPKLDQLLARLQPGDAVVVTRLRRIGRNHKHLLELVEWFEKHQVDFVVPEQGIDTTTPLGRLFLRFLAAGRNATGR